MSTVNACRFHCNFFLQHEIKNLCPSNPEDLKIIKIMQKQNVLLAIGLVYSLVAFGEPVSAYTDDYVRIKGDIGLAIYRTPPITQSAGHSNALLPYAFAEYGHLFARVDTFGLNLLPLGTGNLELSGRVSFEGYKATAYKGLQNRSTPLPVGLSTCQETPLGAFFVHGFYDATSGGTLFDASYAAEVRLGSFTLYPQLGIERRSASYVRHLYGVSRQEYEASGFSVPAFSPGKSISPNLGLAVEYSLMKDYSLTLQVRKKWLDSSITDSPLVNSRSQTSSFLSLTRSFK